MEAAGAFGARPTVVDYIVANAVIYGQYMVPYILPDMAPYMVPNHAKQQNINVLVGKVQ